MFFHEFISTRIILSFSQWLKAIGYEAEADSILLGLETFLKKRINNLNQR